ncbi:MAG: adenylate/guanylate cyclase domain-containing protein [Gemmatimonadales bacterium]|jgi:adenylate cyclase
MPDPSAPRLSGGVAVVRRRARFRHSLLGLAVGAAVALLLVLLRGTYVLQSLELKTVDLRFRTLHDPAKADTNIVIVDVDNLSLDLLRPTLGRYPWPRDAWDALVRYLAAGGAKAVGFDFTFPDPDLRNLAADSAFAAAESDAGMVVQTLFFENALDTVEARRQAALREDSVAIRRMREFGWTVGGQLPEADFQVVTSPYPQLLYAARGLGVINFTPDLVDGTARRAPLLYRFRGRDYPSLGLAVAMAADSARFGGAPTHWSPSALEFPSLTVPLDRGTMLLNWRGPYRDPRRKDHPETYRVYPIAQILHSYQQVVSGEKPEVRLEAFRDKVVFVGTSGAGLFDARANPFGPNDPGVLIHATLADNLLTGDFLTRVSAPANAAVLVLVALLAGLAVSAITAAWGSAVAGLGLAAVFLGAAFALFQRGVWLDAGAPVLAILFTFTGGMVLNYMTEGRKKRQIREMFGKYVAPEYVAQLAEDPSRLDLEGRRAELTILFSDIRGFTSISEKMSAHEVVEFLNEYLSQMAGIVKHSGGTLDKFIGDAVMAFWGEPVHHPDHADRAADCALAMRDATAALAARWVKEGKPNIRIGIGINTAEVVVGNIGSLEHKLDYTVIGDGVNLASRLESQNKEFGTTIIVSEFTLAKLGDRYDVRPLADVKVKGKEKPVAIYELLNRKRPAEGAV